MASVRVTLPPMLLALFPGAERQVALEASTVGEALAALGRRWPGMPDRLVDSRPKLRRNIVLYVGGRRADLSTPLADGDELLVMTGMLG